MKFLKTTIWLLVAVLLIGGIFYLWLPPLNFSSPSFWWFLIVSLLIVAGALWASGIVEEVLMPSAISAIASGACILIWLIGIIAGSSAFNAQKYYNRLEVSDTTFEAEFENVDWNSVPQIDAASSKILGARKMGDLVEEVSQYDISNTYTIINNNGKPTRLAPLEYANVFKYFGNKDNGIPGYVIVDCVNKTAEFVRLEKGIQYSKSACFSKDLTRHLRFKYPSMFFDEYNFEIDDEGNIYYVVSTYKYASGIGGCKTPTGCILVNPVNGDSKFYSLEDVPNWVDHAITDDTAVSMINSWGKFKDGWLNSWIAQKNVRQSTEGSAFITMDNDVYLYTGITSVALDESNIGFIMVNMRTGNSKYFELPSAEEYSAMDSAKGKVQHLNYSSTFPILINVNGHPTYFLSLKDAAGLVKMYAMVSVEDIQKLAVTEEGLGIQHLMKEYTKTLASEEKSESQTQNVAFEITNIYTTILDGNTQYYLEDSNGNIYMTDITESIKLPTLTIGSKVNIKYVSTDVEGYYTIIELK